MKYYDELHVRFFNNLRSFGTAVGSFKLLKSDRTYSGCSVIRQDVKYSELIEALYGKKF